MAVAAFQAPVHAYIDPAATGMLVQVIIGAIAAVGYGIRGLIKRAGLGLMAMFGGRK